MKQIVDTHAGQVIAENHSVVTRTYYAQAWALVTFLAGCDAGDVATESPRGDAVEPTSAAGATATSPPGSPISPRR